MAEVVEAGLLERLLNFFDKLGDAIQKFGYKVEKERELDGGLRELTIQMVSDPKKEILVQTIPVKYQGEEGWFKVKFWKVENNIKSNPVELSQPVQADELDDEIQNMANTYYKASRTEPGQKVFDTAPEDIEELTSSKELRVTLSKIVSDDECDVVLESVMCNYSPLEALGNLNVVLDSEPFISGIPEDVPQTYAIIDNGTEDLDVCECEGCDIDFYSELIKMIASLNMIDCNYKTLAANLTGVDSVIVPTVCGMLPWTIEHDMNILMEVCRQYGEAPNVATLVDNTRIILPNAVSNGHQACETLLNQLKEWVAHIQLCECLLDDSAATELNSSLTSYNAIISSLSRYLS